MKLFWLLLAAAPVLALNAQTNPTPQEFYAATNPAAANVTTNPPARKQPPLDLDIISESGFFDLKNRVFIYTNHVLVTNSQLKMTCETLTVEAPQMKVGKFNQGTAEGNVVLDFMDDKGQNNRVTADKAVYTDSVTNWVSGGLTNSLTNNIVILTGNPVVTNMQGTLRGDPIIWDRLKNTVFVKNQATSIHTTGTNAPDLLGGFGPTKTNSPRAKPDAIPK